MKRAGVDQVGFRLLAAYSIGAVVGATKTVAVDCFLLLFYNQVVGLPAIIVSAIIMASLVCDAIFDPLVGRASDHFRSRWGRRLPFMYASAIPMSLLFVLLWTPPRPASAAILATWLTICLIGVRFCDSLFELPHISLVPDLTPDPQQRIRLFAARAVCESVTGTAVAFLAYNVFMKQEPDGTGGLLARHGYGVFGAFAAVLLLFAIVAGTASLHRVLAEPQAGGPAERPAAPLLPEVIALLRIRDLRLLLTGNGLIAIGSGMGVGLTTYWLIYLFRLSQIQLSLVFAPIALTMLLSSLAPAISARLGNRNAVIALSWAYIALCFLPLLARLTHMLDPGSTVLFALVMGQVAFSVVAVTMIHVLLNSMIADQVEEIAVRTGRRSEGLMFAIGNFTRKSMMGLGTLGAGLVLALAEFPKGATRGGVADSILVKMALLYIVTKVVLFVAATIALLLLRSDRDFRGGDATQTCRFGKPVVETGG